MTLCRGARLFPAMCYPLCGRPRGVLFDSHSTHGGVTSMYTFQVVVCSWEARIVYSGAGEDFSGGETALSAPTLPSSYVLY